MQSDHSGFRRQHSPTCPPGAQRREGFLPVFSRQSPISSISLEQRILLLVAERPHDGSRGFQPTALCRPWILSRGATIDDLCWRGHKVIRRSATFPSSSAAFRGLKPTATVGCRSAIEAVVDVVLAISPINADQSGGLKLQNG